MRFMRRVLVKLYERTQYKMKTTNRMMLEPLEYGKAIPGTNELTTLPASDWVKLMTTASEKPRYVHGEFSEISLPIR